MSAFGLGYESATIPAIRRYTVMPGDSLDTVARKLHLQTTSLEWANPGISNGLHPGQQLVVPAVDGVLHLVGAGENAKALAKEFGIDEDSLLDFNGLQSPSQLRVGMRIMVPNSKPPAWLGLADGGAIGYRQSDYDHFPWGWCTWYVAQRRNIPWSGDAWSWLGSAEALGWPVGMTPRVGAVMVTWESYWYGHVAYVERVNADGSWVVSEMNYDGFGLVDFRTIRPGQVPLIGFIY